MGPGSIPPPLQDLKQLAYPHGPPLPRPPLTRPLSTLTSRVGTPPLSTPTSRVGRQSMLMPDLSLAE